MQGRLTYLDLEMLCRRARIQGQDRVAFHLAMAREVLLEEEFGSLLRNPVISSRIEKIVQEELQASPHHSSRPSGHEEASR
jgi:hypothetical protein